MVSISGLGREKNEYDEHSRDGQFNTKCHCDYFVIRVVLHRIHGP